MRKLIVIASVIAALVGAAPAQAHLAYKPEDDTLKARAVSQKLNLAHAKYVAKRGAGEHKRWAVKAVGWLSKELNETKTALAPKRTLASHPSWLVNAFICIHGHEGAWNANTGNGYYGGLQMDWSFMSTYGPELLRAKGPANNWTPAEQIEVAIRAHRTRGFHPWPNTARYCGLL